MSEPMNKLQAIILYAKVLEDNYLDFSEDTTYILKIITKHTGINYEEQKQAEKCAISNVVEKLLVGNSTEMEVCVDIEKFYTILNVCGFTGYIEGERLEPIFKERVKASLEKLLKAKRAENFDYKISAPTKLVKQLAAPALAAFQEIDSGTLQISTEGIVFKGKKSDVEIIQEKLGAFALHEENNSCVIVDKAGVEYPYVFKFASVDKAVNFYYEMSMTFYGNIDGYEDYLIKKHSIRYGIDHKIEDLYDKAWRKVPVKKSVQEFELMARLRKKYLPDILAEEDRYGWLKKELGQKKLKDKKTEKADSPELVNKIHSLILYAKVLEDNYLNFSEDTIYVLDTIAKHNDIKWLEGVRAGICAIHSVADKLLVGNSTEDEVYADIEKFNKICKVCQYTNDEAWPWDRSSFEERVKDSLRKILKAKYIGDTSHKVSAAVKLGRESIFFERVSFKIIDSGTLQVSKEGIVFKGEKSDIEITPEKISAFEIYEKNHSCMVVNTILPMDSYVIKFDSEDIAAKMNYEMNMAFRGITGGYESYLTEMHREICDLDINLEELSKKAKQKVATEEEELKLIAELEDKYLPDNLTEDELYKREGLYEWFKEYIKDDYENEEPENEEQEGEELENEEPENEELENEKQENEEPENKKPEEEKSDVLGNILYIGWELLTVAVVLWILSLFLSTKELCVLVILFLYLLCRDKPY